jgi:hypothetical protein
VDALWSQKSKVRKQRSERLSDIWVCHYPEITVNEVKHIEANFELQDEDLIHRRPGVWHGDCSQ